MHDDDTIQSDVIEHVHVDRRLLLCDDDAIQSDVIEHVHVDNSLLLNDGLDDEEDNEEDKPPSLDSREDGSDEEDDDSILESGPKYNFSKRKKYNSRRKLIGKIEKTKNKNIPQY